ncbi:hypothetical protein CAPTEDRAFT_107199, partial [Capitella teleta]
WRDFRLKWDPKKFDDVSVARIFHYYVWIPDLEILQAFETTRNGVRVVLYSTGELLHIPPIKVKLRCYRQDDGDYNCPFSVASWVWDGSYVDLDYFEGKREIDLTDFIELPGTTVVGTTAEKKTMYYPCCPEPYPSMQFNITLRENWDQSLNEISPA